MGCQSLGARAARDRRGRDGNNISQGTQPWKGDSHQQSQRVGVTKDTEMGWGGLGKPDMLALHTPPPVFPSTRQGSKNHD